MSLQTTQVQRLIASFDNINVGMLILWGKFLNAKKMDIKDVCNQLQWILD